jgi:DNA polymerase III subunit delta'
VIVINRAELMTLEAANSFLKALEEPPSGNVIILKVKEPLDLLPTIVSRCQKIQFRPLPIKVVKECLLNEFGVDEENTALISSLSDGSLGKALQIAEGGYLEERQKTIADIIRLLSMQKTQAMELAMEYAQDLKKREHDTSSSIDLFELIGIWKTWYRDMIIIRANGSLNMLVNVDFSRKLKAVSKNMTAGALLEGFFMLDRAQMELMKNPNLGLMIENLFLGLNRPAHLNDD